MKGVEGGFKNMWGYGQVGVDEVVDVRLIVVASGVGDGPMSLARELGPSPHRPC